MSKEGIDALIIPTDDPHMSEYTAPYHYRREFISEFTGSAGTVVITKEQALLFTDGRYHNQASLELSNEWTLMKVGVKDVPNSQEFLASNLTATSVIGVDPLVHSAAGLIKLKQLIESKNITLKCLDTNLVDTVWGDQRPKPPNGKIRIHALDYAGVSVKDKIATLRKSMNDQKVYGIVLSSLDEIMWLFNIRG
jgi:Xaa-Pro aminopeptidase